MGATRGAIMRIFLITGASIGIVGTIAGLILGLVFTYNIEAVQNFFSWVLGQELWDPTVRFLSDIPAEVDPSEVISVLVMAVVLSLLATALSLMARGAAGPGPGAALRRERHERIHQSGAGARRGSRLSTAPPSNVVIRRRTGLSTS